LFSFEICNKKYVLEQDQDSLIQWPRIPITATFTRSFAPFRPESVRIVGAISIPADPATVILLN
jgi:hypothetical protein